MSRRKRRSKQPKVPTRTERSAGGLVWRRTLIGSECLIIKDSHDHWALPKGRLEAGETTEQAARREVGEETGLTALTLTTDLGTTEFWFEDKWEVVGERVHKFVSYFLYELIEYQTVVPSVEEHVLEHRWVSLVELTKTLTYKSLKPVVEATTTFLGPTRA